MTIERAPATVEDALFRVMGAIGAARAAEVCGLSADYLYRLANPHERYRLSVADAIKLDLEYLAQGGTGAPIYQTYTTLLDQAHADRFGDRDELARRVATAMREGGEADEAAVLALLPGATPAARAKAKKELLEAVSAKHAVIACLDDPDPP